jgi:hypothetical protein
METLSIILIIISILLIIIVIGLLTYSITLENNRINPKNCPASSGQFGLMPSFTGTALTNCTSPNVVGTSCVFANISNLTTATNVCNSFSNCSSFSYSSDTNTMTILDPNQPLISNDNTDVYIRQVPTIIT